MDLDHNVRRVLGLAIQILEDAPGNLRPLSNIDDMRDLLKGETTGRDGLIVTHAVAKRRKAQRPAVVQIRDQKDNQGERRFIRRVLLRN